MRTLSYELLPDAGSFTPLQLKPAFILAACFNGNELWSRAYGVPHQLAIRDLQTAFVVQVARVRYLERFTYQDAERLGVGVIRRSLKHGAQVEARATFSSKPGLAVAEASLCIVPLAVVGESDELAGLPAPLSSSYLEHFEPSERLAEAYPSPFPSALRQLVESYELLGSAEYQFVLHRQHCEFVDQWFFVEAVNFAAASRESMVFEQGAKLPALRRGLSLPVREVDLLFSRPFYLFDRGKVRTRAFRGHEGIVFVHELLKDDPTDPHSLVVERF